MYVIIALYQHARIRVYCTICAQTFGCSDIAMIKQYVGDVFKWGSVRDTFTMYDCAILLLIYRQDKNNVGIIARKNF